MKLTYYGVRGSIASPGNHTAKYGGNTSCVAIQADDDLFVCDAGTGIRKLGKDLLNQGTKHMVLLLSHAHADHIEGIRFFPQAYNPHFTIDVFCQHQQECSDAIKKLQEAPLFPSSAKLNAKFHYHELKDGESALVGETRITAARLEHPGSVLAYRITRNKHTIVYATDNEDSARNKERLVDLARGVDLLICDAQYTPEEFKNRIGWGHSTYEQCATVANKAGVGQLHLFHHDPERSDEALEAIVGSAQQLFQNTNAAREGLEVRLGRDTEVRRREAVKV